MEAPRFLDFELVCAFHRRSIERFGGSEGLRDRGQVLSALGAAETAWFYGSEDIFGIAAAYAFHLAEAQAFVDGNKRTAAAAALAFIRLNGGPLVQDNGRLYDAMIDIANRRLDKVGLAAVLRNLSGKVP
jgi:death on curing protein